MKFLMLSASLESFLQLISTLLIFVFVLAITYFTTRWIAKYQKGNMKSKNLRVIETVPAGNNMHICLVKTGTEYLVVSVGKDNIRLLTTLKEEQLTDFSFMEEFSSTPTNGETFQDILGQLKDKMSKK